MAPTPFFTKSNQNPIIHPSSVVLKSPPISKPQLNPKRVFVGALGGSLRSNLGLGVTLTALTPNSTASISASISASYSSSLIDLMMDAFSSLFSSFTVERVGKRIGISCLFALVFIALLSTTYERACNDIRLYMIFQLIPCIAIPGMTFVFPPKYTHSRYWLWAARDLVRIGLNILRMEQKLRVGRGIGASGSIAMKKVKGTRPCDCRFDHPSKVMKKSEGLRF